MQYRYWSNVTIFALSVSGHVASNITARKSMWQIMLLESAVEMRIAEDTSGALPLGQQDLLIHTAQRTFNPARDSNPESPDVPREITYFLRTTAST
eukprot:15349371-Ditylum_brightwellii.AAC.1